MSERTATEAVEEGIDRISNMVGVWLSAYPPNHTIDVSLNRDDHRHLSMVLGAAIAYRDPAARSRRLPHGERHPADG